jgi:hypothetical protein
MAGTEADQAENGTSITHMKRRRHSVRCLCDATIRQEVDRNVFVLYIWATYATK